VGGTGSRGRRNAWSRASTSCMPAAAAAGCRWVRRCCCLPLLPAAVAQKLPEGSAAVAAQLRCSS
jgi:hypothetical protein